MSRRCHRGRCGRELGGAVVVNLVGSGYTVVAVDRNEDNLGKLPDDVHREVVDAFDPAAAKPLIDRIVERSRRTRRPGKHPRCLYSRSGRRHDPGSVLDNGKCESGSCTVVESSSCPTHESAALRCDPSRIGPVGLDPTDGMAAYGASKAALVHPSRHRAEAPLRWWRYGWGDLHTGLGGGMLRQRKESTMEPMTIGEFARRSRMSPKALHL